VARFSGSGGGEGTPGPEGPAGPPGADANTGDITFDGIQIIGAGTASGDGLENGTIDLVPDGTLETDQYLIIDPTAPNHIHIRAGGTQDGSSSDLFLGGERNNVRISDGGRDVAINARPATVVNTYTNLNATGNTNFIVANSANIYVGDTAYYPGGDTVTVDSVTPDSPSAGLQTVTANLNGTPALFVASAAHVFTHEETWNNSWQFRSDGVLLGPAMGSLAVNGIFNNFNDSLYINSSEGVIIDSVGGEFLHDDNSPENQIATIGDVAASRFGASASYHSRVDQGPQVSANLVQPFTFSTTDWETGILRVENKKIKMLSAGKYNIAFSAQLYQTSNTGTINIWLNKNDSPMAYTNTKVVVESNAPYKVAAWNFFVDAAVDDYYEIMWSSSSTNTRIEYDAAQTINGNLHPEIPSIIVTVNQVG
jgi:hypothetical protein